MKLKMSIIKVDIAKKKIGKDTILLEYKRLILSSHEYFLLHVNIEMCAEIRLALKKQISVANCTRTHLLHKTRSD